MGRLGRETICPLMSLNQVVVFVMGKFELNGDDVVSMESSWNLINGQTFKIEQVQRALAVNGYMPAPWLSEQGVECEVLSANQGGGWKKGKIRIRFEFIEDKLPPESPDL